MSKEKIRLIVLLDKVENNEIYPLSMINNFYRIKKDFTCIGEIFFYYILNS